MVLQGLAMKQIHELFSVVSFGVKLGRQNYRTCGQRCSVPVQKSL